MSNRIQILLLNREDGESLTFPVNPEKITISNENNVSTYNLLNYGEVNVIGDRKAQAFTLEKFLPANASVWAELSYLIKEMKYKPYTQSAAKMGPRGRKRTKSCCKRCKLTHTLQVSRVHSPYRHKA